MIKTFIILNLYGYVIVGMFFWCRHVCRIKQKAMDARYAYQKALTQALVLFLEQEQKNKEHSVSPQASKEETGL